MIKILKFIRLAILALMVFNGFCFVSAQTQYTKQNPLKIRGDFAFPPYEYLDDEGNPQGFNVEIVRAIMDEIKIPYELQLGDWGYILKDFKDGKADVIAGISFDTKLDSVNTFISPFIYSNLALVYRTNDHIGNLEDLKGRTILMYAWYNKEYLPKQIAENNTVIPVYYVVDGLRILEKNQMDVMLCPYELAQYYIKEYKLKNIQVRNSNLPPRSYGMMIHKGDDSLMMALNNGLDIIKSNGKFDEIYNKWFNAEEEDQSEIIYMVLGCVLLLIILFVVVTFILRRKISIATKDLQNKKEQLDLAFKAGDVLVWGYDVEADRLYNIVGEAVVEDGAPLKDTIKILHPDDVSLFFDKMKKVIDGEPNPKSIIVRIKYLNTDKWDYIEKEFIQFRGKDGKVNSIIGTHKNVTAQVKEKNQTKELLGKYQNIFDSTSVLLEVYDVRGNRIIINPSNEEETKNVNQSLFEKRYMNKNVRNAINNHEAYTEIVKYDYDKTNIGATPYNDEYYIKTTISPIINDENRIEFIVVTYVDITENIKLTKEYHKLSEQQGQILNFLPLGVLQYDSNGDLEYANLEFCSILGIENLSELKDFRNNIAQSILVPQEHLKSILAGETAECIIKFDFDEIKQKYGINTSKSGFHYLSFSYRAVRDEFATIKKYVNTIKDVTEYYLHQQEIADNHQRMELAMKVSKLALWNYDVENDIFTTNNEVSDIETFEGRYFEDIAHKDDIEKLRQYLSILREGKNEEINFDIRVKRINSLEYEFFHISGVPLSFDKNGKVKFYTGFKRDNTEWLNLNGQLNEQNYRNQLILDNITSGLVYLDKNHHVVWENVSQKFPLSVTGSQLFVKGKSCEATHGKYKTACANCTIDVALNSNATTITEKKLISGHYIEITSNPIKDHNGENIGVLMRIDDITAKRALNKELLKAKNEAESSLSLLTEILDRIPSSIFIKDADNDFKYILANKWFRRAHGDENDTFVGLNDNEIYGDDLAAKFNYTDRKALENPTETIEETEEVTVNGVYSCVKTRKSLFVTKEGKKLIVAVTVDMTELQETNNELKRAKEKAEESDKLKSAFLANMSHEIRTPLNAIVGFSDLLTVTEDPEDRAKYNSIILSNNDMLLRLINDILDLSKLDAGAIDLYYEDINMNNYLDELNILFSQMMTNPNVTLNISNPYKDCTIKMDKGRLTQVITNFMSNAIKYTEKGHITLGYKEHEGGLLVYVRDTGVGIPADKVSKVFNRFEKLDRFVQGTGLGLSISKALVELCGGIIGFESQENEGTLVWALFPIEMKISETDHHDAIHDNTDSTAILGKNYSDGKKSILVVEDNDDDFHIINSWLSDKYNIFRNTFFTKDECLMKIKGKDCVLFGLSPNNIYIWDMLPLIKEVAPDIPIVVITDGELERKLVRKLNDNISDFIYRPLVKTTLQSSIDNIMNR